MKIGNTINEIRELYANAKDIDISESDFESITEEAKKELDAENEVTPNPTTPTSSSEKVKKDNRKKTYEWHRVHEGKFPKELVEELEKYDLEHENENQELAEKRALAIIDNFGIENALKAVEKGYIKGAEKAVVFSKAVEAIQAEMQLEIDLEIREKLARFKLTIILLKLFLK